MSRVIKHQPCLQAHLVPKMGINPHKSSSEASKPCLPRKHNCHKTFPASNGHEKVTKFYIRWSGQQLRRRSWAGLEWQLNKHFLATGGNHSFLLYSQSHITNCSYIPLLLSSTACLSGAQLPQHIGRMSPLPTLVITARVHRYLQ